MAQLHLTSNQIIEHLEEIDRHVHLPYKEYVIPRNVYNDQEFAQSMMQHVGLSNYEVIIKYERVKEGTAGHICLNNNPDHKVYITLSERNTHKSSVIATLAHEVCHKLLYCHNLYYPEFLNDRNEALADLANIYAGFGKYVIEGCEITSTSHNTTWEYGQQTKVTTTTTHYTGYLSKEQFEEAYKIVRYCNSLGTYKMSDDFMEDFRMQQQIYLENDAETIRNILYFEELLLGIKSKVLQRQNEYISLLDEVNVKDGKVLNPYRALVIYNKLHNEHALNRLLSETNVLKDMLRGIITYPPNKKYLAIQENTLHIVCPVCGYKAEKQLNEHKKLLTKCPKCKHVFLWDSSKIKMVEPQPNQKPHIDSKSQNTAQKNNNTQHDYPKVTPLSKPMKFWLKIKKILHIE